MQVTRDATTVTVTVTADVLTVIPFGSFTVHESAAAPVEAFTGVPRGFSNADGSSAANQRDGGAG